MKAVISILFLACCCSAHSQMLQSDTLKLVANWEQGETYHYTFEKYYAKKSERDSQEHTTSGFLKFEILEKTNKNYVIKITLDSIFPKDIGDYISPISLIKDHVHNQISYVIETNLIGGAIKLKNLEEIKKESFNQFLKLVSLNKLSDEEISDLNQELKLIAESDMSMTFQFTEDFIGLFGNYGYQFNVNDTLKYDQKIPSTTGGSSSEIIGKIYFDISQKNKTNTITLYDESVHNKTMQKAAIIEYSEMQAPEDEDTDLLKKMDITTNDISIEVINLQNGSINYAVLERSIKAKVLNSETLGMQKRTWKLVSVEN